MPPRKPLRLEEVPEQWHKYFDFEQQGLRPRGSHLGLFIWTTCPDCGWSRWYKVANARRRGSPYCRRCATIRSNTGRCIPLLPEEIDQQWHKYFDFTKQELHYDTVAQRKNLYIWVVCPGCQLGRWRRVGNIRQSHNPTAYCNHCGRSGTDSPSWHGGRSPKAGYLTIHSAALSDADRVLAEPMLNARGYVKEHRLIMARHIGRSLRRDEIVHHINGVKDDNHLENLRLLKIKDHHRATGDDFYQKWQEALAENARLKAQLAERDGGP